MPRRVPLLVAAAAIAIGGAVPAGAALTGPDAHSVERLYRAYFLRDPDAGGLAYWEEQRAAGVPLPVISDAFAASAEFDARYGALEDPGFVGLVYRNVLEREPDDRGRAHWVATLRDRRLDRGGVMLSFSDSAEFKERSGLGDDSWPPTVPVPPEARAVDTSSPDHVIGTGTPSSCTSPAVVEAVARGGTIVFDCGPDPVTIVMEQTAKIRNDADPDVVIDGGGLVTLSGGGARRTLYMNTCDRTQVWTTSHCQDQDHPRLTLQHLAFVNGDATGAEYEGGGAVFVRGGRLKIVDSTFRGNRCDPTGPDVAGGALRVLSQHAGQPVLVTGSTFEGNECSNGGAIGSIGVSWTVRTSTFRDNRAIGVGANPRRSGTPGGGNGGAVYNDGNAMSLRLLGTSIEDNHAREGGGAVFFVSNDRSGWMRIESSTLLGNVSEGFETQGMPGIFFLGRSAEIVDWTVG